MITDANMSSSQSRNTGTNYTQYPGTLVGPKKVLYDNDEIKTRGNHWLGAQYTDPTKGPKEASYVGTQTGGYAKACLGNSYGVTRTGNFDPFDAMDDPNWLSSPGTGPGSLDDENFPFGPGGYAPSTNAGARGPHTARPDDRSGQGNSGFGGYGRSQYTQYPQGTGRSTQGQNHGDDGELYSETILKDPAADDSGIKKEDENSEGDVDDKSAHDRAASSARDRRI